MQKHIGEPPTITVLYLRPNVPLTQHYEQTTALNFCKGYLCLFVTVLLCLGAQSEVYAQITISVKVNHNDDDAEERTNDGSMYLNSSDLELVDDGSRDQIVGMRFMGITIPQGTTILDAYIQFETDETNSGTTNLTFHGEDVDDAARFTNSTNNISNRPLTSASVNWNNVPPWTTVSEKHNTPDLTSIIQEIVNRGGWSSGNDMVIIVSGSGERTAESHNGESANAPKLFITYDGNFDLEDCYTVKQTSSGELYSWEQSGSHTFIGNLGVPEVETMVMNGSCDTIFTADGGDFGTINPITGSFTSMGSLGQVDNPTLGTHTIRDVDGMAIDNLSGYIYASERRNSSTDLLFLIDPRNGQVVQDAFGAGIDYVPIPGALLDIDDLAFSPCTGELFGVSTVSNSSSVNDIIVKIDIQSGVATPIVTLPECDSEGMGFNNNCDLFVSAGNSGCVNAGAIFQVNLTTGALTEITDIGGDVEAVVCCVDAPQPSPLACTVLQTNSVCGSTAADIEVFPTGGTGGYVYAWSNGPTTKTQSGVSNGTYTVTVTDFSGNTTTCEVIAETYDPSCSIVEDQADCDKQGSGQATVTLTGVVGAYSLLWSDGQTTATATGLDGGLHTVTVTDGYGCTSTCTIDIQEPAQALICNASQTQYTSCGNASDGEASVVASFGIPAYTYLWDNGQTSTTATGLSQGLHSVTVEDSAGCTTSCSVEILQDTSCCQIIYTNRFLMYKSTHP